MILHVDVAGSGEPLVLLHGFMGNASTWNSVPFARRFRTLAADLPGHGQSATITDPQQHRIEQVVASIAETLDQLRVTAVHLLGYSMGGRVALYFASVYPQRVKSLVLESASPGIADPAERAARAVRDAELANRIEREGLATFVDYWQDQPLFASQKSLPAKLREEIRASRLRNNPAGVAASLRSLSNGLQPSLWSDLDKLVLPTLLITGALDTKYVEIGKRIATALPNAQIEVVAEAGHTVHLEQPDRFYELVVQHVDRSMRNALAKSL